MAINYKELTLKEILKKFNEYSKNADYKQWNNFKQDYDDATGSKRIDFSGNDFTNLNLDKFDFNNAILERCTFEHGSLIDAKFEKTLITNTSFSYIDCNKTKFCYSCITETIMKQVDLTKVDFSKSNLWKTKMKDGCTIYETILVDAHVEDDFYLEMIDYLDKFILDDDQIIEDLQNKLSILNTNPKLNDSEQKEYALLNKRLLQKSNKKNYIKALARLDQDEQRNNNKLILKFLGIMISCILSFIIIALLLSNIITKENLIIFILIVISTPFIWYTIRDILIKTKIDTIAEVLLRS